MQPFLTGIGNLTLYFVIVAGIAITCRIILTIPDELFRKILHCILLGSLFVFIYGFTCWQHSALAAILFEVVVYPILLFFEKFKTYSQVTTERKKGELKQSLLLVFSMFTVVISICWGWFGEQYLVLATIYAWGVGDAAAALIGKKFGKHKITGKYIDGKKSVEGSLAMFLTSFVSVTIILCLKAKMSLTACLLTAFITAIVSTFAEAYSKDGNDTVFCPLAAMFVLIPCIYLLGGFA